LKTVALRAVIAHDCHQEALVMTMSRTHKDRPYWVKSNDPAVAFIECHDHSLLGRKVVGLIGSYEYPSDCTIDVPRKPGGWNINRNLICRHVLPDRAVSDSPQKWARHELYYGPERLRTRDGMRRLTKEFAASGTVDDSGFQNYQHRHATIKGGYWD
jgi:hypothetical protein